MKNYLPLSPDLLEDLREACAAPDTFERVLAVIEPVLASADRRIRELQRSHAILRGLIDSFPGGIVSIMDLQMRHLFIGGETISRLGYHPAEMIGKTPSEFRRDAKSEALEENLRRAMRGESVRNLESDGDMSTLAICTPIYDEDGDVVGTILVGQDVTDLVALQEQKLDEERVRARLEREVATSRARAHIVEQLLHEIRNPLTALASSAEMLQNYHSRMSIEKRADHLERIYGEVRKLASTLSQLAQITE